MQNSKGQTLYEIVSFDNSDGNFTGNPSPMACNLPQSTARKMLEAYRNIKHEDMKYRYIMRRQSAAA